MFYYSALKKSSFIIVLANTYKLLSIVVFVKSYEAGILRMRFYNSDIDWNV
jgi:hypothetical protein